MNRFFGLVFFMSSSIFAQTDFVYKIPDFTQTHIREERFGFGKQLCGPVAASNVLYWLSDKKMPQEAMIKKLASQDYMNTSLKNGTGTSGMLRGIENFSQEWLGGLEHIEYRGWRKHPKRYSKGQQVPSIEWIKSGIDEGSAILLNVGWYKNQGEEYLRIGGHWVTLVGYRSDTLIIHDPAPRAGQLFSNEYVSFSALDSGTLSGTKKGLPRPAKGYIQLKEGMHIKKGANMAIIDGVIKFSL